MRLANGYQVSQAMHVAAELKLADYVDSEPRSAEELGQLVGARAESLYRLLRALTSVGVFEETADRRFVATAVSELLRSDHPRSMRGWPLFVGSDHHWEAWHDLLNCVRTGEDAYRHLHGVSCWDYRSARPEARSNFSLAMSAVARSVVSSVISACDFDRFDTIVDVGGADGALLTQILIANSHPRGIVFDLAGTVGEAAPIIEAAGLQARCTAAGGSYFDAVPEGGDAYILKSILHDCPDEDCGRIFGNVRKAMAPGARVLIIESIMGEPGAAAQADAFSDLNMLVNTGGRERRFDEWQGLCAASGFKIVQRTPTQSRFWVIEAESGL
jgi:hypothetical protein